MKQIRVVMVDDHEMVRDSVAMCLQLDPAIKVVAQANNGNDAVELLTRERPDVALMDIEMPGRTCFEVVSLTRDMLPHTKFVILSATWGDHFIHLAQSVDVAGYVLKTEGVEKIRTAIHMVAEGKRYYSAEISERMKPVRNSDGQIIKATLPLDSLSPRETEVLIHLARGMSIKEVAGVLKLSHKTIDNHTQNLMNKLNIHTRTDLVRYAIRERLVQV